MIIPEFIVDKSIIDAEIRVIEDLLMQQSSLKKTLVLYLEKISTGVIDAGKDQDISSLISCMDSIKSCYNNTKENIDVLIKLKSFLESAITEKSYNSGHFTEYNNEYMKVFTKISKDNIAYYSFMEEILKHLTIVFSDIPPVTNEENTDDEQLVKQIDKNINKAIYQNSNLIDEISFLEKETLKDFKDEETVDVIEESIESTIETSSVITLEETTEETSNVVNEIVNEVINEEPEISLDVLFDSIDEESLIPEDETVESASEESIESVEEENIIKEPTTIEEKQVINEVVNEEKVIDASSTDLCTSITENENTLIISEAKKFAVLPYFTEELIEHFSDNPEKYTSLKDIIDKEYTFSLDEINKNISSSRFKESFSLAKQKSNLSLVKATSFAYEISSHNKLNPIIIKACKNVDELNDYINCLENDNLNNFKHFKILYE